MLLLKFIICTAKNIQIVFTYVITLKLFCMKVSRFRLRPFRLLWQRVVYALSEEEKKKNQGIFMQWFTNERVIDRQGYFRSYYTILM